MLGTKKLVVWNMQHYAWLSVLGNLHLPRAAVLRLASQLHTTYSMKPVLVHMGALEYAAVTVCR